MGEYPPPRGDMAGENMLLPMGENSALPAMGDITPGDMNSARHIAQVTAALTDLERQLCLIWHALSMLPNTETSRRAT